MRLSNRSLSFRIIASSGAWVIIALAVTAWILIGSYRDHAARHYDQHVMMHLEELLEAGELGTNGVFTLAYNPSDPRYLELHSGWYWEVRQSGRTLKRSPSLGDAVLDIGDIQPSRETTVYEISGPLNERLRVHVLERQLDTERDPLVYLSSSPVAGFTDDVVNYSNHIMGAFVFLGFGLLMAVVLQVRIALTPIRAVSSGIARIREGKASKLPKTELEDVQTLVDELNNLLEHNAILLKRARNRLGDLAHSVKNPLTVINNEARNMDAEQGRLITKQTSDISKSVDHYLSRARAFGTEKVLGARSSVKVAVADLVYVMQRICKQQNLRFDDSGLNDCWFRGEAQDLEEILGNLLDNSCKWAEYTVVIQAETAGSRLTITVEDDGPGIPEDEVENVMRRGHKLDVSKPGHGQGLGIVRDIVELYSGKLTLGKSSLGGLKATIELPAA